MRSKILEPAGNGGRAARALVDSLSRAATPRRALTRRDERGVVLVWAMMSVLLVGGLVLAGAQGVKAVDSLSDLEWQAEAQVYEVARAGIVDAYAWLRRQPIQPVTTFEPKRIGPARPSHLLRPVTGWLTAILHAADPKDVKNETDEPDTGLVRAFEISQTLWGRYEVRFGKEAEAFVDENLNGRHDKHEPFTDADGDGKRTPASGMRDLTTRRGLPGAGGIWEIECVAEIFHRADPALALDEAPNRRLAHAVVTQEVRRLGITIPASAAICSRRGDKVRIENRGRVRGSGSTAIAYGSSTGTPYRYSTTEVTGGMTSVPSYRGSLEDVFGVDFSTLQSMADISTNDGQNELPKELGDSQLVVVDGNLDIRTDRPLRGTGVLVVRGNLTIHDGANAFYSGIIYVTGDLTVRAPAYLRGCVIGWDDIRVLGAGGDFSEIEADAGLVQDLVTRLGRYRLSKAPHHRGADPGSLGGRGDAGIDDDDDDDDDGDDDDDD